MKKSITSVRDHTKIVLEEEGKGFPLFLLHGNGEDRRYFKQQIPTFAQLRRVIAVDSRAHGESGRGTQPLTFWTMADDVVSVMDSLNIDQADILGFSDGGNLAIHLALRYPKRVRSLILNGANLSPAGIKLHCQAPIVLGYYCCAPFALFSKKAKGNLEILGLMVHHPHLEQKQLAAITCPCLVIAGEKDMVKEEETKRIAEHLPHSFLEIVPSADHFVAAKNPEQFNQIVTGFLKTIDQGIN